MQITINLPPVAVYAIGIAIGLLALYGLFILLWKIITFTIKHIWGWITKD